MVPMLLAGPPAAGKTATARRLAASVPLAAFIDVDDVRQLVVSGHAAPWDGAAGREQQRLGVENACDLARRFHSRGIDVIVTDVLSPETASLYRHLLPQIMIIGLRISLPEAWRRAALRPRHLTAAEFERLHHDEATHTPPYDKIIDVDGLDIDAQLAAVRSSWEMMRDHTGRDLDRDRYGVGPVARGRCGSVIQSLHDPG